MSSVLRAVMGTDATHLRAVPLCLGRGSPEGLTVLGQNYAQRLSVGQKSGVQRPWG